MKRTSISMLLAIPLMGFSLEACSQEQAASPATGDTAVHDAETAVATADELMAKGKSVYDANCAACHQPDGSGPRSKPSTDTVPPTRSRYRLGFEGRLFGLAHNCGVGLVLLLPPAGVSKHEPEHDHTGDEDHG